jgi:hypothetical protein
MFCFGVLLPGFVLFGWTRNARDATGILSDGLGVRSEALSGDNDSVNVKEFKRPVAKSMDQVIIFGETEFGRDSNLNGIGDTINATSQRDFIRKVGF